MIANKIIKTVPARAGLIGNPSDGYNGRTISVTVGNFFAEVCVEPSIVLEIIPPPYDRPEYRSMDDLSDRVRSRGYQGGKRLIEATIKRFYDFCKKNNVGEDLNRNFTLEYDSTIPYRVGLAGSSALVTATMQALMDFYKVEIPKEVLPNIILSVETEELGIGAGLQDRVIQVYGGVVYMDFSKDLMDQNGHGAYKHIDPKLLPSMFLVYDTRLSEGTEVVHNPLRQRFNNKEPLVVDAMQRLADMTLEAKTAIEEKDHKRLAELVDENFDIRAFISPLSDRNILMVDIARRNSAHAKLSGSSGAAIGIFNQCDKESLKKDYISNGFEFINPKVVEYENVDYDDKSDDS